MKEFIVYDNQEEEFIDVEYVAIYSNGIIFKADLDNEVLDLLEGEQNRYEYFNYIHKKDIFGNKIYADSSIVEWDNYQSDDDGNMLFRSKHIGYLSFDNYDLHYLMKDESSISYEFCSDEMRNIKVIGTLQQDKHLLGEEK